jgi:hypothetical protein
MRFIKDLGEIAFTTIGGFVVYVVIPVLLVYGGIVLWGAVYAFLDR